MLTMGEVYEYTDMLGNTMFVDNQDAEIRISCDGEVLFQCEDIDELIRTLAALKDSLNG